MQAYFVGPIAIDVEFRKYTMTIGSPIECSGENTLSPISRIKSFLSWMKNDLCPPTGIFFSERMNLTYCRDIIVKLSKSILDQQSIVNKRTRGRPDDLPLCAFISNSD